MSNNAEEEDNTFSNYKEFLKLGKSGDETFDPYLDLLLDMIKEYQNINPYTKDPLRPLTSKADAFLARHSGKSFEDFLKGVNPNEFTSGDYKYLPAKKNIKRRYFRYKSLLYLSALEHYERKYHNTNTLID